MWKTSSLTEEKLSVEFKIVEVTIFFDKRYSQTLREMKMFFLCQNIDLELFFPFLSSLKRKFIGAKIVIWFEFPKSNGPTVNMLSEATVKEKLNGKTATALLNERSNPAYNENGSGNQFSCSVKLLNFENQIVESTGYGSVWYDSYHMNHTIWYEIVWLAYSKLNRLLLIPYKLYDIISYGPYGMVQIEVPEMST